MLIKRLLIFITCAIGAFSVVAASEKTEKQETGHFNERSNTDLIYERQELSEPENNLKTTFDILDAGTFWSAGSFQPFGKNNDLVVYENSGQWVAAANIYQFKALAEAYKKNISQATSYYHRALICYQASTEQQKAAMMAQNMAYLYYLQGKLNLALAYNRFALHETIRPKLRFSLLLFKNRLLIESGRNPAAIDQVLRVILPGKHGIDSRKKELYCYYQLGKAYLAKKDYTPAKWFFVQAHSMAMELQNQSFMMRSLLMLSKVKSLQKDYSSALNDLEQARRLNHTVRQQFQQDLDYRAAFLSKN